MGRFAVLLLALGSMLAFAGCGEGDIVSIQQTFASWKSAVETGDGEAAAKLVDRPTLAWWAETANHAAKAEQHTLEGLDINMTLAVLKMRQAKSKAELANMAGVQAYAAAVSSRWVETTNLGGELADVRVDGTTAVAALASAPDTVAHRFTKESEGWRVSLIDRMKLEAANLRAEWGETSQSRSAFALGKLKANSPEFPDVLLIGPRTE